MGVGREGGDVPGYQPLQRRDYRTSSSRDRNDARRAIDAARDAFDHGPWPKLPPRARGDVFLKAAQILQGRLGVLAELESRNQGKTIKQAADADLPFSIDNLVFYTGAGRTLEARSRGSLPATGRQSSDASRSGWSRPSRRGTTPS